MGENILSVIYLLLVIALVFPGFYYANKNKKVFLKRTHENTLKVLPIETLKKFAIDLS